MRRVDDFPALDGLRAVGAIAVLLTHVAFQTGQYPRGLVGGLLGRLDSGVALFFVLSGFLLSLGFLRPLSVGAPHPSYRDYAVKRFFRIWPVLAVTVVIATTSIGRDDSLGSWLHSLTLTHLYGERFFTDGLTQMWSLETEVAFYVLLPFLMAALGLVVRRRGWSARTLLLGVASLGVVNLVWITVVAEPLAASRPFVHQWLPAYAGWFALGIALAVVWVDGTRAGSTSRLHRVAGQLGHSPGASWAVAVGLLLVATTPVAGPLDLGAATQSAAVVKSVLYGAVALLVVLPAVHGPTDGRYQRALSWSPVRYLGHVSYGIFCIHLVVLWYVQELLGNEVFTGSFLQVAGLTLVLSVAAAAVLHHLVERPAMRLSRRLLRGTKAPAAAADRAPTTSS